MSQANPITAPAVSDRSTEFVATTGGHETTSAEALLISAYIVMWALVLLFVWASWRRQSKLDARLDDLQKALELQNPDAEGRAQ